MPGHRNAVLLKSYFVLLALCMIAFIYVLFPLQQTFNSASTRINILQKRNEFKYILQWAPLVSPFDMMGQGQSMFIQHDCKHYNCYVTNDKNFYPDLRQFDAVVFSGKHIPRRHALPPHRSASQKYIFAATESAHNYRICDEVYDGYFNWTWTYRLDSDFRWGYITIYDLMGHEIGPRINMTWPKLNPISDDLKRHLSSKHKAAAWFVSHCSTLSKREQFVKDLQREVSSKNYDWTVDVYGSCGTHRCPRSREDECFDIINKDYFFYLSFENSFADDYVTEKLLNALNNNAVPIVYGSANYSRFLPPGSYLDARELGVVKLAETMNSLMNNRTAYYKFFRWQNHFKYKETTESDVCNLCAALNDEDAMSAKSVYENFRKWWNDKQWDGRKDHC